MIDTLHCLTKKLACSFSSCLGHNGKRLNADILTNNSLGNKLKDFVQKHVH